MASSRKLAENVWQFSMNLIKMEEIFLPVRYALEIDLRHILWCQHYLQNSQTYALKNRMLSPNSLHW